MATDNGTLDILYRGDDIIIPVTIEGDGTIAGWTFEFGVWATERVIDPDGLEDAVIQAESDAGIEITSAMERTLTITLAAADVESLGGGRKYPFRLRRTNVGGRTTLATGKLKIGY